jgi:transcription elongation factor GreB
MSSTSRSNYITPEGAQILRAELRRIWRLERPEWTQRVSDAAKEGDRSENAEYIYSKKKLRELDHRIRYLTKRLEQVEPITRQPDDQTKVFFGAWVRLMTEQGEQQYRLVGSDEFDHEPEYISIDSPLARALVGKSIGDCISVKIADRHVDYEIVDVYYAPNLHHART